jgi:hypothetical protein
MSEGLQANTHGTHAEKNSEWVIASLEADQLSAAKARHYPRRRLKPSEKVLLWTLRIYLLFMLGVVFYQVWTSVR